MARPGSCACRRVCAIRWQGDDQLVVETDAGQQTRTLSFAAPQRHRAALAARHIARQVGDAAAPAGRPRARRSRRRPRRAPAATSKSRRRISRRAGCARTACRTARTPSLTEYFARFKAPNGDEWLMVTTIVDDPSYLKQRFVTSSHFRREPQGGKWNPKPCGARHERAQRTACCGARASLRRRTQRCTRRGAAPGEIESGTCATTSTCSSAPAATPRCRSATDGILSSTRSSRRPQTRCSPRSASLRTSRSATSSTRTGIRTTSAATSRSRRPAARSRAATCRARSPTPAKARP